MRFIASADWQLGMSARFLDEEPRARYIESRFEAVERIGKLAGEHDAEFVVVGGDVFESNQLHRSVISRAFEAMRECSVPIVLLPGNHDPLDAATIYDSPAFTQRCPVHVHVLRSMVPFEVVPGVEVVGAPWRSKRPLGDLIAELRAELEPPSPGTQRVLVGHGAVSTLNPNPDDLATIDVPALERMMDAALVQFAVLGDKHSTTQVLPRVWYPGTPEVTDRTEPDPGNVLLIDIDDNVRVTPLHTGRWRFLVLEDQFDCAEDIDDFEARLEAIPDKSRTACWLKLSGTLSTAAKARLEMVLENYGELFALLALWDRHCDLVMLPDNADFAALGLSGFAKEALDELVAIAATSGSDSDTAQDAVQLLYRLAGGGR